MVRGRRSKKSPAADGRLAADFYQAALSEAERLLIEQARGKDGLEEEMALLRVKLQTLAVEHLEDISRLKLLDLLTRMVV
jgi:hypothetical protein